MVEQAKSAFYMFYGMLNLEILSRNLPFEGALEHASQKKKYADLKSKAVALTCSGWSRVFSSRHASIQERKNGQIRTFGVELTPAQQEVTDMIESVGIYYDKVQVPVTLHHRDGRNVQAMAYAYKMRDERVQDDLDSGLTHEDDSYVKKCANSDLLHYQLQGIEPPACLNVEIFQADLSTTKSRKLREVAFDLSSLLAANQGIEADSDSEAEESKDTAAETESSENQ